MSLTQSELDILTLWLGVNDPLNGNCTHPLLKDIKGDYLGIQTFLDNFGTPTLEILTDLLLPEEQGRYFLINSFADWYGNYLIKLSQGNVEYFFDLSKEFYEGIADEFTTKTTASHIDLYRPLQKVFKELNDRFFPELISHGLYMLCNDGIYSKQTGYRMLSEMAMLKKKKRYQGLKLSSLPTIAEIEGILKK